jgi:hypothetical protein
VKWIIAEEVTTGASYENDEGEEFQLTHWVRHEDKEFSKRSQAVAWIEQQPEQILDAGTNRARPRFEPRQLEDGVAEPGGEP